MSKPKLSYRKAVQKDIDYLLCLREQTMTQYLADSGFEISRENFIERINYHFEDAKIILWDEDQIGLIKVKEHDNGIEIIQIQIVPEFQGKGIGKTIINEVLADAGPKKLPVTLSVLKTNPACSLYQKLGFVIIDEDMHSYIMRYVAEVKTGE